MNGQEILKHPSSSYARILFRYLRLNENNSLQFFDGTKVTYKQLMTLDGSIGREDMVRIFKNAIAIAKRNDLGLSVGSQLGLSTHGALGVATFTGPNLRTAMELLAKYSHTRTEFFEIKITKHPQGMRVCFIETFDLDDLREFVTEAVLIGFFSAIKFFLSEGQFKGPVAFGYAKPSYADSYQVYFGDNLKFNQPLTEVVLAEHNLSIPSLTADSVLHQQSIELLERELRAIKGEDVKVLDSATQETIAGLLVDNPGRIWTLDEVAAQLYKSPRTLIRKLAAEGTSFQTVKDEVAKRQTINYLKDPELSFESIAHLIGFSEVSSFRRSFKRWFGETPSQYVARVYANR